MKAIITLPEVLKQMDQFDEKGKPVPFSIKFVTCDLRRKSGGELIELENVVKCVGKKKGKVIFDDRKKTPNKKKEKKNPKHWDNSTRNILIPSSGQIRKCHIRLITEFNGQKVIY